MTKDPFAALAHRSPLFRPRPPTDPPNAAEGGNGSACFGPDRTHAMDRADDVDWAAPSPTGTASLIRIEANDREMNVLHSFSQVLANEGEVFHPIFGTNIWSVDLACQLMQREAISGNQILRSPLAIAM
jgi:hypothetical protein